MGKWAHLYESPRWRKLRLRFLAENPVCVLCLEAKRMTLATVVDHVRPHRGDLGLFWDSENNWQSLCKACHDSAKQQQEKSGVLKGSDSHGFPLDPNHHWRR